MKKLNMKLFLLCMLASTLAYGQYYTTPSSSIAITAGAGISSYYGDLTEKVNPFTQPSYAFSLGAAYNLLDKFSIRADVSYLKLQAADSKNKRVDLKARNLNFKSNVWDVNIGVGYDVLSLNEGRRFTPNIYLGAGIVNFNSYTIDRNGEKKFLQPLGTEGQGLSAYPDRKPYKRTEFAMVMGVGLKYVISESIVLHGEFRYRYLNTDYLDDVSRSGYPDISLINGKNASLSNLTYRGDEISGGASYPANKGLNRGNPSKNDAFYTTQIRIAYRIN